MTEAVAPSVRVRRAPRRARYDRESIHRVLDRECIAHIAFSSDEQPYCIPTLYARAGDRVLIHGSSASRMIRCLTAGAPACLTVTILDGLVLASSVFEHSANYDSVTLLGRFERVDGIEARLAALEALTDALVPGRWSEVRPPSRRELKSTAILSMEIGAASVKTRHAPPDDDEDDRSADGRPPWTGVVPVLRGYGPPQAAPGLHPAIALPRSVQTMLDSQSRELSEPGCRSPDS